MPTTPRRAPKFAALWLLTAVSLLSLAGLVGALAAHAAPAAAAHTAVSGPILTDTVWTAANSPYLLTNTVTVPPSLTLTLEPGVEVRAAGAGFAPIVVEQGGTLLAVGTAVAPITFTTALAPAPGAWDALQLRGTAEFAHVTFAHGGDHLQITGRHGGPVTLTDSRISGGANGLRIDGDALHRLQMNSVTFANNLSDRVLIYTNWMDGSDTLAGDVTLSPHPGLDAYALTEEDEALIVPSGITLTILPAVTMMFPEKTRLSTREGHLLAIGTSIQPIRFTSLDDSPSNQWNGLGVRPGLTHLEHVVVRYARTGIYVNFAVSGQTVIKDSAFEFNKYGYAQSVVVPNPATSTVHIRDTAIRYNDFAASAALDSIHFLEMANVTFEGNSVNRFELGVYATVQTARFVGSTTLTAQPGLEAYELPEAATYDVPLGVTLTLEAGVTLMMGDYSVLVVNGSVQSLGNPTASVTITKLPSVPHWGGMVFYETASAFLRHTTLEQGVYFLRTADRGNQPVTLQHVVIRDGSYVGMVVDQTALHRLQMADVRFENIPMSRIIVQGRSGAEALTQDARLRPYPGLEAYQFDDGANFPGRPHYPLVVPPTVTLTINPGVALLFEDAAEMQVHGRLHAAGASAAPITFTNATTMPWAGITVSGTAVFEHVSLTGAGGDGLTVAGGRATLRCSTLANNQGRGVVVTPAGAPDVWLQQSNLTGNGVAGVQNDHPLPVHAAANWWGSPSGPSGAGPGSGDAVLGNVVYAPWLAHPAVCGWAAYLPVVAR